MNAFRKLSVVLLVAWAGAAHPGDINGGAVIGGGLGGAAGAAVGSAVGGKTGAIVGAGVGGAAGAAIGSSVNEPKPQTVYIREGKCWPPGHCKGRHHHHHHD
ncbi:MAG: glycine zipper domain-containing protein [Burkholderiales bacterium]|nr:glycine zipper domain-containing protein [Burkholderiales bacterium]